jgi:hypothetical protein
LVIRFRGATVTMNTREMFEDFCEECINKLPADQLSGFGIRCKECDPEGIEREGTYYDACVEKDEAA